MRNGLPDELDAVRSHASMRRRADENLTEAIDKAIKAGILPADVELTISESDTWPPPLADPDFKDGWFAAQDRHQVPVNSANEQMFAGFEAYVMRARRI